MAVDKNLFLYDLAVVAILKNEAPYLKEWLDYHLMAGVDHFYLYDNESPDNQAEIVKPYVEAGLVDYFSVPGQFMQMAVYNDAVNRFKFQCRYMAFIDGDEFIFPKTNQSIVEVVDEIFSKNPNAAGLSINWQLFGTNGHEKADFSKGVLERFTRRAPKNWSFEFSPGIMRGNVHVKTIANPRAISGYNHPHYPDYFEGAYSVNENGNFVQGYNNDPVTAEKIVINHYFSKSTEEFFAKQARGRSDVGGQQKTELFHSYNRNDEFDDSILKYRDARAKIYQPPDKSHAEEKLLNALMKNLAPALLPNTPPDFYVGKMETFLTCRGISSYLKTKLTDDKQANCFEEASLVATLKSFNGMNFTDARLFLKELPIFLSLPYPIVKEILNFTRQLIPQMMDMFRSSNMWKEYVELDYLQRLLSTWK